MAMTGSGASLAALAALIGEWRMVVSLPGLPPAAAGARVRFAWLPSGQVLIQRCAVPVPEAPDGIAIIGADHEREGGFLQSSCDTRGIARVYQMSVGDGDWNVWRAAPDVSPLAFRQPDTGTVNVDGTTIAGAWESSHNGTTREHDFDLIFTRA